MMATFSSAHELDVFRAYSSYAHTIDDGDIRGWADLFASDGSMSVRGGVQVGPDALYQSMKRARTEGVRSLGRHLIMNIEVRRADEAGAVAIADFLHVMAGTGGAYIEMIGRYNTVFTRLAGRYLFREHAVTILVDKRNPEVPLG